MLSVRVTEYCRGLEVVDCCAGNEHTVILTADGSVYTCGYVTHANSLLSVFFAISAFFVYLPLISCVIKSSGIARKLIVLGGHA